MEPNELNQPPAQHNPKLIAGVVVLILVLAAAGFYAGRYNRGNTPNPGPDQQNGGQNSIGSQDQVKAINQVKQFESEEEFKNYLSQSQSGMYGGIGGGGPVAMDSAMALENKAAPEPTFGQAAPANPRYSETNVQVAGVDEPDIVKTDGQNLFISTQQIYYGIMAKPLMEPMTVEGDFGLIAPYQPAQNYTRIISALPPQAMKELAKLEPQGEMLLSGDTLVVFTYEYIYGISIKDKSNPKEIWKIKYENNSYLNTARMYDGKLYIVTSSYPSYENPCPIVPLSIGGEKITVPCREIYHPIVPTTQTTVYSAAKINPESGKVEDRLSFVGSTGQAIVYMSENAIYLSYTYMEDQFKIMLDFLKSQGQGLFPADLVSKIDKVNAYDLSSNAKLVEMQYLIEKYLGSMDNDGRIKFQNDMQNKLSDYLKVHKRDLQFTGIAKIPLDKFEISATGNVPGSPLNQFSMDEYQGNLRIATTIGGNGFWFFWGGSQDVSANDVYVLDGSLNQIGKVMDLGKEERIYSVRFIGDKGYLVTFKQVDPFYVLDLSNPANPAVKGELKIPGFSSYLHPLAENLILGVGQENSRVKLSLFDVSNPAAPQEIDKYSLDEYWTEASNNHHAFLQDNQHSVFFLPGGSNGYIFSYSNNKLNLVKALSNVIGAQRALYINDTMYIVGGNQVIAVDEKTWERVGEISW